MEKMGGGNTQACNQLGTPAGRRVFWEWPKFVKLCPILSNYVQHTFPGGAKNFLGGLRPCVPLVTNLATQMSLLHDDFPLQWRWICYD